MIIKNQGQVDPKEDQLNEKVAENENAGSPEKKSLEENIDNTDK